MFGIEAVTDGAPMLTGTADTDAGVEGTVLADRHRARLYGVPVRGGFLRQVLHHAVAERIVQLIHSLRVIGELAAGRAPRPPPTATCAR